MLTRMALLCLGLCSALAAAAPAEKDQAYNRLIHEFMAPCCWQQRLDIHDSPLAEQLRRRIRESLTAGQSEDEVRRSLIAEFGIRILPEPPGAKAVFLYAAPFVVLGIGTLMIVVYIRAKRRRKPAEPEGDTESLPDIDLD
jgi:cytochrome c-type biogenesis protein CcmH